MRELSGEIEFGKGLYHNQMFEETVRQIKSLRTQLATESEETARRDLFSKVYGHWSAYTSQRFKDLPEEMLFTEGMVGNLTSVFERHRDRRELVLLPDRVQEMHFEFASLFKFNPVIDVQYIEQMIHPSRGYLTHMPRGITIEELTRVYEMLIVATFEKLLGQVGDDKSSHSWATGSPPSRSGTCSIPKEKAPSISRIFRLSSAQ